MPNKFLLVLIGSLGTVLVGSCGVGEIADSGAEPRFDPAPGAFDGGAALSPEAAAEFSEDPVPGTGAPSDPSASTGLQAAPPPDGGLAPLGSAPPPPIGTSAPACAAATGDISASSGWRSTAASQAAFDTLQFEFLVRPAAGDLNGLVAIGAQNIDEFTDAAISVRFTGSGLIDARDGPVYDSDLAFAYNPGLWYSILVSADIEAQTYDVEVGRCGEARQPLITGAQFRSDAIASDRLTTWALWSSQSALIELSTPTWVASGNCAPATCSSLGSECGVLSDGCGGILNCGSCGGDDVCTSGICVDASIPPPSPVPPPSADTAPSAATTGINDEWCPDWENRKSTYTGPTTITTPGTVIEYKEIDTTISVRTDDVSMRCVKIDQPASVSDNGILSCRGSQNCNEGFYLENVHIQGSLTGGEYKSVLTSTDDEGSFRRIYVLNACDGMKFDGGMLMESFFDEPRADGVRGSPPWDYCSDSSHHKDTIQSSGQSGPFWLIGNHIEGPWDYANGGFFVKDDYFTDITVVGNYFRGGQAGVFLCGSQGTGCGGSIGAVRVSDNVFVPDSFLVGPFRLTTSGIDCFETKSGGSPTNAYTTGSSVDPGGVNVGTCPVASDWPRSGWPETGGASALTRIPTYTVTNAALSSTSCTAGVDCGTIDISANRTTNGDSNSPPRTTGSPRWRYRCGQSATQLWNKADGVAAGPVEDLAETSTSDCDGQASCTIVDACDFTASSPGTYTVKIYSESGPGSGVRISDHDELTFRVNP